jgi:hypothetical protein
VQLRSCQQANRHIWSLKISWNSSTLMYEFTFIYLQKTFIDKIFLFLIPSETQHGLVWHWSRQGQLSFYYIYLCYSFTLEIHLFPLSNSMKKNKIFWFNIRSNCNVCFYAISQAFFNDFINPRVFTKRIFRFNLDTRSWSVHKTSCDVIHMTFLVFIKQNALTLSLPGMTLFIMTFMDNAKSTFSVKSHMLQ